MRYIKDGIEVEAVFWNGNTISEVTDWIKSAIDLMTDCGGIFRLGDEVHVFTKNGLLKCYAGDYLVKDDNGIYPCRIDIFDANYEKLNDLSNIN